MKSSHRVVGAAAAAALLAACASSPSGAPAQQAGAAHSVTRRSPDLITAEELQAESGSDLLTAIKKLRPAMIQIRGLISTYAEGNMISVYVNGSPQREGVDALARLRVEHVTSVRKLTGAQAEQEFGAGNVNGAIVVTTR